MNTTSIQLIAKELQALSPWATLTTRTITSPRFETPQTFHSLRPHDYISVLALTGDGQIPLVRQYRPTLESVTLELPGGLLDAGGDPVDTAVRELEEETGYVATAPLHFLGELAPDTGRLENRIFGYFAENVIMPADSIWRPEADVEHVLYTPQRLREAILSGEFEHALHIAVIAMAIFRGHFHW